MGLEMLDQVADLDVIVVPTGGGGLLAGICLAVKTIKPEVEIVAVEPARCPSFAAALEAGQPVCVDLPASGTLADGLAVPCVGPTSFEVAKGLVDRVETVLDPRDLSGQEVRRLGPISATPEELTEGRRDEEAHGEPHGEDQGRKAEQRHHDELGL